MTTRRGPVQILLTLVYALVGLLAIIVPDTAAGLMDIAEDERSSAALFLIRVFGAASLFAAFLLFRFITDSDISQRLMLALALYEIIVIIAAIASFGADDLESTTLVITVIGSAVLVFLNLWGAFLHRWRGNGAGEEA